jgi:hypothetical protein
MKHVSANEKAVSLNLHRYAVGEAVSGADGVYTIANIPSGQLIVGAECEVGLCTLNQVDP